MPEFSYKVRTPAGAELTGTIEAENEQEAKQKLESKNYTVLELKKLPEYTWEELLSRNNRPITTKDLMLFTKHLAVLVKAGIPVVKALQILEKQIENIRLRKKIKKIRMYVEEGNTLANAFARFPETFDNLFCNLIKVGEESGLLYEMLTRLNAYIEKSARIKGKVKSAMVYPIVVMTIATGVVTFLMIFVIPRFQKMFASFGGDLPGPTKVVIAISNFLKSKWYIIFGTIVFLIFLFKKFKSTPTGKVLWDKFVLKLPLFGDLVVKYSMSQLTGNLAVLLRSGISISRALAIIIESVDNEIVKKEFQQIKEDIEAGRAIGEAFERSEVVPVLVAQMVAVGDQTGTLESMLEEVSIYFEEEVDNIVEALMSLIEPIMIVFLGTIVAGILIAMFLPIFKMAKLAGKA